MIDDEDNPLKFTGFDDCILGVCECWDTSGYRPRRLIYSGEKIIESLMLQGLDNDDAIEHFNFNIDGAYVGPSTPIVLWEFTEDEL